MTDEERRERRRLYDRRYYEKHREEINKRARARYLADPAKTAERCRLWRNANREKVREYKRNFYHANKELINFARSRKKSERLKYILEHPDDPMVKVYLARKRKKVTQ